MSVADGTTETKDARKDDPERRPGVLGGAPALADEGDVAFGGMAGIAVLSAILVSMLALAGFFGYNPPETTAAPAPTTEAPVEETTTTTEAPAEEEAAAPVVVAADAVVDATNDGIVLSGTVPSEEVAESIRASAAEHYTADQIDDQLVIEDGADPFTLTVNGALDSDATVSGLGDSLGAVGSGDFENNLSLSDRAGAVAALNDLVQLEPILFESGTAVIIADSQATLDEAAEILKEFPDAAVEVGGHTDSRGDDASNQTLSQQRADAVVAALQERGVANDLTSEGYGETQLKENPDDTPEQQQLNRRIEFTLL